MGIDVNQEVFGAYAFYAGILLAKMMVMIPLTARQRFSKKVFTSPEDTSSVKGAKVAYDDPDVERVRRAHLNDLENILPFFATAFLYCFTSPAYGTANLLFKVFTGARILHTLVYAVFPVPQPARAISFFVAMFVQVYMVVKIISHFA
ncbi:microsomal glutathione S-transferase 1 [Folsomia candida]|uniref:Microsomal glutathione S-transferase 1 n=1 Tax=Folsomia candida TaxID=158441 RepID=A0A226F175_FOLCA|nr:microsomal glutathione S-transferase 1 [Folsomia candida]OXA63535.1 Microsomal glutathione S-transferase 1 [Folsomia candida]